MIVCLTKFDATRAFDYVPAVHHSQRHGRISVHTRGAVHTVGLVQYAGGHFVSTDPPGEALITEFFTSWVEDGVPTIAAGSPAP